ncbi:hypothetical protein KM043_001966 [Ampulex compressa]|nr:hypothetical protein KM043_001966 [Ampulex compressa]
MKDQSTGGCARENGEGAARSSVPYTARSALNGVDGVGVDRDVSRHRRQRTPAGAEGTQKPGDNGGPKGPQSDRHYAGRVDERGILRSHLALGDLHASATHDLCVHDELIWHCKEKGEIERDVVVEDGGNYGRSSDPTILY